MESVQTIFGTSIATIQADALKMAGVALPAALIIAGVFIAVKIGMRIYKAIAK